MSHFLIMFAGGKCPGGKCPILSFADSGRQMSQESKVLGGKSPGGKSPGGKRHRFNFAGGKSPGGN